MAENILLASGSPRRLSLLSGYGYNVSVTKPDFDEDSVNIAEPSKLVAALAKGKGESVALTEGCVLLAADTVVAIGGNILGKPRDKDHAFEMLSMLSGNTHSVYTGVCLRYKDKTDVFCVKSDVTFHKLSKTQIENYIDTGSPFDKAGSYGIQDPLGIAFVDHVDGSLTNVIGLPMAEVTERIAKIKGEAR